jgi:hypothetical protein
MQAINLGDWERLTADERVELCRMAAGEARQAAQAATSPEMKRAYRELAAHWHQLAAEVELFGHTDLPLPRRVAER